jgi:hypothetical protein
VVEAAEFAPVASYAVIRQMTGIRVSRFWKTFKHVLMVSFWREGFCNGREGETTWLLCCNRFARQNNTNMGWSDGAMHQDSGKQLIYT